MFSLCVPLESVSPSLGEPCTHLYFTLCERFVHLSTLIGQHSTSLSYFLPGLQSCDVTSLALLTHTEYFLEIFKEYVTELYVCQQIKYLMQGLGQYII